MINTVRLIDHNLCALAVFPGYSPQCSWVAGATDRRNQREGSIQTPGTFMWPLEEHPDFPLNIPTRSEKVKAVSEGVNLLPSRITGALTIHVYPPAQLLCPSIGRVAQAARAPGLGCLSVSVSL